MTQSTVLSVLTAHLQTPHSAFWRTLFHRTAPKQPGALPQMGDPAVCFDAEPPESISEPSADAPTCQIEDDTDFFNPPITEMVFIIDQSGSMMPLREQTVQGFNRLLEEQKQQRGIGHLSTLFFDTDFVWVHQHQELSGIRPLQMTDYQPRGMTALYDAIGMAIQAAKRHQKSMPKFRRPNQTLFVIMTDGYENASREYTLPMIRKMITKAQKKKGWTFLFLGADLDAQQMAGEMGMNKDYAVRTMRDKEGMDVVYSQVSQAVGHFRECACMAPDWKDEIEQDYVRRSEPADSSRRR